MSDLELVLTMLSEATTPEISKRQKPTTFVENKRIAQRGGTVAGRARADIEEEIGAPVVTSQNAQDFRHLISDVIEDIAILPKHLQES